MSIDQTATTGTDVVRAELVDHLSSGLKTAVAPDQDLFADGLVSSMAAMQLVIHLEQTYEIDIVGKDLRLDNFRTVDAMVELVLRLRAAAAKTKGQ
ncbi:methoxymalonate biosynthesis acyl carrier protein [Kibdelosporangium banguiense]|uniref:Methoxymalonate biosynthesis acyl carrier protein n=1 Tax=Kibdelosporangium banguiense TaxID=1365924 RepID=A0ABS4TYR3_9PSEU|nr:acyl carrier protein [Kibdelosporangium banguiense]MBP2329138.1 methoxymalonate biosynthesis acyl carrier protein [Kibdelosporangium banguiense]